MPPACDTVSPHKSKTLGADAPRVVEKRVSACALGGSRAVEHDQSDDHHQCADEQAESHDAAQVNLGHFVSGLQCSALIHDQPFKRCSDIEFVSLSEHFEM